MQGGRLAQLDRIYETIDCESYGLATDDVTCAVAQMVTDKGWGFC